MKSTFGTSGTANANGYGVSASANAEPIRDAAGDTGSSPPASQARQEAAAALRQNMGALQLRCNSRAAREQTQSQQNCFAAQRTLLEAHGFFLTEGTPNFSPTQERQLRTALTVLTKSSGDPNDAWSNLRSAFLWGRKDKIDAAFVLHSLGLFDLNAIGPEGDALIHAMVLEPIENREGVVDTADSAILSIAERFALLKQHGVEFSARNADNLSPIELALSLDANVMPTVVAALIAGGVDVHEVTNHGTTLLYGAVQWGYPAAIGVLVGHHVDIHAAIPKFNWTALHYAAYCGKTEVVIALLDKGANIDVHEINGWTALHIAADKGYAQLVDILLDKGACIEAPDNIKLTALHHASKKGRVEAVNALLRKGASTETHDMTGQTALHLAVQGDKIEIVQFVGGG